MVFEQSGGRDFDLPRHSHYSGVIPMVFEHSVSAHAMGTRMSYRIHVHMYRLDLKVLT